MAHTYRLNKNKDINLLISGVRTRLILSKKKFLPLLSPPQSKANRKGKQNDSE